MNYDLTANTKGVVAMLDAMPEVERAGLMIYKDAAGFPWIDLVLAKGQNGNFHCADETWHEEFNMIPIVCSKTESGKVPATQINFLIRIAEKLNWELINEENDAGQEDVLIWKPI